MIRPLTRYGSATISRKASLLCAALVLASACNGCLNSKRHTLDPKLEKIDAMLAQELPNGTTFNRVNLFLNSRGYIVEGSPKPHSIVAVVHLVDTETLEPATARDTFRFDDNDKLTTYELDALPEAPFQR